MTPRNMVGTSAVNLTVEVMVPPLLVMVGVTLVSVKPFWLKTLPLKIFLASASPAVISPSESVSMAAMAASRRAGTSRYCKFSLPQFMRNKTTGLLCSLTASTLRGDRAVSTVSRRWRVSRDARGLKDGRCARTSPP